MNINKFFEEYLILPFKKDKAIDVIAYTKNRFIEKTGNFNLTRDTLNHLLYCIEKKFISEYNRGIMYGTYIYSFGVLSISELDECFNIDKNVKVIKHLSKVELDVIDSVVDEFLVWGEENFIIVTKQCKELEYSKDEYSPIRYLIPVCDIIYDIHKDKETRTSCIKDWINYGKLTLSFNEDVDYLEKYKLIQSIFNLSPKKNMAMLIGIMDVLGYEWKNDLMKFVLENLKVDKVE